MTSSEKRELMRLDTLRQTHRSAARRMVRAEEARGAIINYTTALFMVRRAAVERAIEEGVPRELFALAHETGVPAGAVRSILGRLAREDEASE